MAQGETSFAMRTERGQMRRSRRCHLRGAKFGESVESLEDASIRTSLLVQSVEGGECFAYLSLHDKWGCVGGRKICDLGRKIIPGNRHGGLLGRRQSCTLPDGSERYCSLLGRGRSRTLLDSREKHGALLLLDGCGDTARASTHS